MNHDDESELFNRLEADMNTPTEPDPVGEVVDLDKARSARTESADPGPTGRPTQPTHGRVPGRATRTSR